MTFPIPRRIEQGYRELRFPLQHAEGPSPELTALFRETRSYLRFLGLQSAQASWQLTLILADSGQTQAPPLLPPIAGANGAALLNLSSSVNVAVRLETAKAGLSLRRIGALSGQVLGEAPLRSWRLTETEGDGLLSLLVAVTRERE